MEWTGRSLDDREKIYRYLAGETGGLAIPDQIDASIERTTDLLNGFPQAGRPGRIARTRELLVAGTPYLLVYKVRGSGVWILRVIHQAQRWPPLRT